MTIRVGPDGGHSLEAELLDMDCPLTNKGHCPGRTCPFWLHGECLISEIDLSTRPDVVVWLDHLRRELAARDLGHTDAASFNAAGNAAGE